MRFRPLLAALLCLALVGLVACGEEESGLGEGQEKAAEKQKDEGAGEEAAPDAGAAGANVSREAAQRSKPTIKVPGGQAPGQLEIRDLQKGTGATLKAGDQIAVNYSGVLYKNGKEFDSSFGKQPFQFQLGGGMVIPGWDKGLEGAKVGARRQLIIPPEDAYGAEGSPPTIGPNEPLVFVIDVLGKQ
ncbi:MAG TPA: FKBP-type peptidyl-prolyl cis-trans isomerase [Thermoleophilaceae bacterium]|nr:FKBP-type peptidyl-prolyl cis-trans isomerase [Thermoleophilaceae bacterium]